MTEGGPALRGRVKGLFAAGRGTPDFRNQALAAAHRRDDGHLNAFGHSRGESAREADAFVSNENVDVLPDFPFYGVA